MPANHTLTACCPFGFGEIEVKIIYRYTPGRPARGPSYASGGEPADHRDQGQADAPEEQRLLAGRLTARSWEYGEDLLEDL